MNNFIVKNRPFSFNSLTGNKKITYKNLLKKSYERYNPTAKILNGELYAVVYYFYKEDLRLDADNISKPVWDCLSGIVFDDDEQIKLRFSGSFDLNTEGYNVIDFSTLPEFFFKALTDALDKEKHVLYIEIGKFKPSLFLFNLE